MFNKLNNKRCDSAIEFNIPAISCYLIPLFYFLGTVIYLIARFGKMYISGYYLIHYLYTHDHGYISRGLIGEVLSWFFETLNDEQLANINIFFNICLALSCSLFIGKALETVRKDKYRFSIVCFIVLVFFVFAAPVRFYCDDVKLDKNLWTLTFLAVFLAQKKIGIYIVPAICMIATMINPVFLFCSMILISIVLLQEFYSSNFSLKNGLICAISYISMIALGIFATISEKFVNFSTPSELIDFYFSRYSGTIDENVYRLFEREWLFNYFDSWDVIIRKSYEIYFVEWSNGLSTVIHFLLIALPAYIILTLFWKKAIQLEENKFQKFIFFLCAVTPAIAIPPTILSWEFSKYFYNTMLIEVGLIIYFVINKSPSLLNSIKEIELHFKKHFFQSLLIIFYFILFIAIFSVT